ncbi:MAG: GNAT family N-acetyltransferase [Lachnospiraceae bacterium]|nr:GNAT family N-acetyltransferase [Lachnospiraceae bacterium]
MEYEIKSLSPELAEDYIDFFDNRAFADGSPFFPCYCNAFNLSKERMIEELYQKAEAYGEGLEGWKRALRESAERMVKAGEIKGYLAYDQGLAIGWCNANDRMSYYRTGEFDLHTAPENEAYTNCSGPGEVKAIVCFEIAPDYRGKGIASQLLGRVCEDAKADGYRYVEAYPVKDGGYLGMAFTGPMHLYEKAGFELFEQNDDVYTVRKQLTE